MTSVDDRLRDAAASLRPPEHPIPPFRTVRQRARRRRAMSLAAVVVILVAVGSAAVVARPGTDRVLVTNPASTAPGTTSTATGSKISINRGNGHAPHDYPHDLVGDAPPIAIDHVGKYTWTSAVVLPFLPDEWNSSYQSGGTGTADIRGFKDTLATVTGGYSLRVTFTVVTFTGSPTLTFISHASGPISTIPPPGTAFIPDVIGMSQTQATSILGAAGLGVVVAHVGTDQPTGNVVAESPVPGTALRLNGVVTITVGSHGTSGP